MQIKRFEAKDMTTALRLIKKELGSDAVILSARSLKKENKLIGRVKSVGVEVTAAVDAYHLSSEVSTAAVAGVVSNYRRNETLPQLPRRNMRRSLGSRIKSLYDRKPGSQYPAESRSSGNDGLADVFQHLMAQEVKREVANDIIDRLAAGLPAGRSVTKEQIISGISKVFEQKRDEAGVRLRGKAACRVLAVVGVTGAGKTTTIAKLAAQQAIEEDKATALISLDSDRVGGAADLAVYAKAMGIPLKTAGTRSAIQASLDEFRKFDLILVDTPGFNPRRQDQIDDLKSRLEGIGAVETHLALPAMSKESDLFNTLRCLDNLDIQQLIFTKLDESCTYGNLINVWLRHPLPLSFLTHGRDVPHNITTGSIEKIVERLMSGFHRRSPLSNSARTDQTSQKDAAREDGNGFVANKNSDVFHHRNCKWTRKIKSKNMISFSSAQAAELADFLPCQDCHPDRSSRFQAGLPVRDNVRISNFS